MSRDLRVARSCLSCTRLLAVATSRDRNAVLHRDRRLVIGVVLGRRVAVPLRTLRVWGRGPAVRRLALGGGGVRSLVIGWPAVRRLGPGARVLCVVVL